MNFCPGLLQQITIDKPFAERRVLELTRLLVP